MRQFRGLALVTCLCVLSAGASFADSLTANFDLNSSLNTVPSQGTVSFVLNANGTIAVTVTDTNGSTIVGFGYDSVAFNLPESNFSPTAPNNAFGWGDAFGVQPSGFLCSSCGFTESFTIGTAGEFTSVFQALGGTTSTVDFFLFDSHGGQWGGNASGTVTPEPGSLMLLGTGILGLFGPLRRKIFRQAR